ncbi:MAG TPA: hypothetical protein PKO15_07960 [Fibrobacteria bacterium]|nr:hypothetical protein [Fibrobacteria bacterium]HOX51370.1 hypothetical protein [Fibrobacteria bacterium]
MTSQDVPKEWRSTVDLFEVGFVYVFLPLVVSTMDRPPFHLGGKILLWMVAWFFLRRLSDHPLGQGWFRKNWVGGVASLLGATAISALLVFAGELPVHRAVQSLLRMGLMVLPACALVFLYLPVRLSASEWIPEAQRPVLPALAFAGLHLSSGMWRASLLALVGGYVVARWKLPIWVAALGQWVVALAGARFWW